MIDSENILIILICIIIGYKFRKNLIILLTCVFIIGMAFHSIYAHQTPDEEISITSYLP